MVAARRAEPAAGHPAWRVLVGVLLVAAALAADAWLPPVFGFVEVILGVSGLMQLGRGVRAVVLARRPGLAPATFDRVVRRLALGFLTVLFAGGTILLVWMQVGPFGDGTPAADDPWWARVVLAALTVGVAGMAWHAAREWRRAGRGSAT